MEKRASEPMGSVLIVMAVVVLVLAGDIYIWGKGIASASTTLSPITVSTDLTVCRTNSKGVNDIDGDKLDDYCDPCINRYDSDTDDKNGNHMTDACEGTGSSKKKIVCYGTLYLNNEPDGKRCCDPDDKYAALLKSTGLNYECKHDPKISRLRTV